MPAGAPCAGRLSKRPQGRRPFTLPAECLLIQRIRLFVTVPQNHRSPKPRSVKAAKTTELFAQPCAPPETPFPPPREHAVTPRGSLTRTIHTPGLVFSARSFHDPTCPVNRWPKRCGHSRSRGREKARPRVPGYLRCEFNHRWCRFGAARTRRVQIRQARRAYGVSRAHTCQML